MARNHRCGTDQLNDTYSNRKNGTNSTGKKIDKLKKKERKQITKMRERVSEMVIGSNERRNNMNFICVKIVSKCGAG